MNNAILNDSLERLLRHENISFSRSRDSVLELLEGHSDSITTAAFLTALAVKGETADELAGATEAVRHKTIMLELPGIKAIDLVGTGGDRLHTFNVSTAAAFVTAAAGLPVAKHGNRNISSRCGSADVLEALGVPVDLTPEVVEQTIREIGIGFMYAPAFHLGMNHVGPVRKSLGFRTIFNMIGPLANPASVSSLLVGVYAPQLTELFAEVLHRQGVKRALVVHGSDGMDELTMTGPSRITLLNRNETKTSNFYPGLYFDEGEVRPEELVGGNIQENAVIIKELLAGKIQGGKKNIVLLNAGAALFVGEKVDSIQEGIEMARETLQSGKALRKLQELIDFTHRYSTPASTDLPQFNNISSCQITK